MFRLPGNNAQAVKASFAIGFGILAGLSLGAFSPPAAAQNNMKISNFSKSGAWSIVSVQNGTRFSHCSAGARYKSGTRVGIVALASGQWRLSFYHAGWPERTGQKFQARLVVDGREVLSAMGQFNRKSALIDLGTSADRIQALMKGQVMAVETPSGKSSFRLDGSRAATGEVARCWAAHARNSASSGAFGAPSQGNSGGAFGAPASPPGGAFGGGTTNSSGSNKLSRADTMELATRFLGSSTAPYEILPAERNVMKNFPVNWRYRSGTLGGMMAFRGATASSDVMLSRLLAEQTSFCKGSVASQRGSGAAARDGQPVVSGTSVCSQPGSVVRTVFSIWKPNSEMLLIVIEAGVQQTGAPPQSSTPNAPRSPSSGPRPNEI